MKRTNNNMDGELFQLEDGQSVNDGPVTCLGITFENEAARREFFRDELRKKLPELKLIEGFPIKEPYAGADAGGRIDYTYEGWGL